MTISLFDFDICLETSLKQALGDESFEIDYSADLAGAGFDSFLLSNFVLSFEENLGCEIPQECLEEMAEAPNLGSIRTILRRQFVGED